MNQKYEDFVASVMSELGITYAEFEDRIDEHKRNNMPGFRVIWFKVALEQQNASQSMINRISKNYLAAEVMLPDPIPAVRAIGKRKGKRRYDPGHIASYRSRSASWGDHSVLSDFLQFPVSDLHPVVQ